MDEGKRCRRKLVLFFMFSSSFPMYPIMRDDTAGSRRGHVMQSMDIYDCPYRFMKKTSTCRAHAGGVENIPAGAIAWVGKGMAARGLRR
ncbi:hypothetical protein C3920_04585 [Novacetimonas pomaceti]|uniref:Secreted protein n=1 Tax=Novacetimonas pomaceti TaxID=2021998 RepID=A0ABX5P632_9PROT|nr:hypothetical protein C3920_04585 [Novacetimonas pomaceti]